MFEEIYNQLHYKQEEMSSLRSSLNETSDKLFSEGINLIFEKHPEIKYFSWSQYTPYFMDGDPCIFGVNSDDVSINGHNLLWDEDDNDLEKPTDECYNMVSKFLSYFDNDFYLWKFGDHSRITIYPDKIEIEDCDHD